MSNSIRFPSLLNQNTHGYEYTGDTMTFWDQMYRNGNVVHGALGYYLTYGDSNTQHTPLSPVTPELFTDALLSLTDYLIKHPEADIPSYQLEVRSASEQTIRFLGSLKYNEQKDQYFQINPPKVSTSASKQYDKRWFKVPTWAIGEISSAVGLYMMALDNPMQTVLEKYAMHDSFHDTLRGTANYGDWDKVVSYQGSIPLDHHSAFCAFRLVTKSRDTLNYAQRCLECAVSNSKRETVLATA